MTEQEIIYEIKKKSMNSKLFDKFEHKTHFDIEEALDILGMDTLPIEIKIKNNLVFIRDLAKYMVDNGLKI